MSNEHDLMNLTPLPNGSISPRLSDIRWGCSANFGIPRLDALVIDVGCPRCAEACHQ